MHTRSNPTLVSRLGRVLLIGTLITGGLTMLGCASSSPPAGITAVTPFDLQRYQGQWYELARLDHVFERGMSDVTATYTPRRPMAACGCSIAALLRTQASGAT